MASAGYVGDADRNVASVSNGITGGQHQISQYLFYLTGVYRHLFEVARECQIKFNGLSYGWG